MNGVFQNLPPNVYVYVYADDILIVAVGDSPGATRVKAQATVSAVYRWASSVGFTLSAPKSVRGHVCNSNHQLRGPAIHINGQKIPNKKIVKVLGVSIDRHLTFKEHFNSIKSACKTRINLIKTISRPHRSNNRDIRLRVAQAIVDSRLLYGLEITCLAREKLVDTLGPVFNSYVRIISGLLPSTPADSACAEAGILPFRHRVNAAICRMAVSYASKTAGNDRIHLLDKGDMILRAVANARLPPVAKVHWHGAKSWLQPTVKNERRISSNFKRGDNSVALRTAVIELLRVKYPNHEHRYTDGSLSSSGVGLGVSGPNMAVSNSLATQCSVFSAEAAAIFVAVTTPSSKPLLILSDSASVLSALESEKPTHPWIQGILANLPPNTTFVWVPGHCGIPGNHTADLLAGTGHQMDRLVESVPPMDLKRWSKREIRNFWAAEWSRNTGAQLRKIKGLPEKWDDLPSLRDQKVVSRLRTGHVKFAYNYGRGVFRKDCDVCGIHNSVEHVICNCPKYSFPRATYGIPGSVRDALADDSSSLAALLCFLKDAGLYFEV